MQKVLGRVLWFDDSKGYGFIRFGEEDVYVKFTAINGQGFKTLTDGESVSFELIRSGKVPYAESVDRIKE